MDYDALKSIDKNGSGKTIQVNGIIIYISIITYKLLFLLQIQNIIEMYIYRVNNMT